MAIVGIDLSDILMQKVSEEPCCKYMTNHECNITKNLLCRDADRMREKQKASGDKK